MARDDEKSKCPGHRKFDRRKRGLHFLVNSLFCLIFVSSFTADSQTTAEEVLKRALALADLYNWADAAPLFEQAERMLSAVGDERNSLRAKFGRIRSNIERQDRPLALVSAEIGAELADNPLLQSDKSLRMFALIVKGDIDTETDTSAMRQDWEQVAALAAELGDKKWAYRALAQLGVAAFYDADLETARKNVGTALALATQAGDKADQIRFLTMLATGLVESRMYEQALPFFERALSLASNVPEAGYQFPTQYSRLKALIGLGQLDAAQLLVDDVLLHARRSGRSLNEATAMVFLASIHRARGDVGASLSTMERAMELAESKGLNRTLAEVQALVAEAHRELGHLDKAEHAALMAASTTQASGDLWAVPQRLHALAQLHIARGKYQEADQAYERAEAFIDASIGRMSTVLEKTALIKASSDIYARHFALASDHFNDAVKAYAIVEQVRGRIAADLLISGSRTAPVARQTERAIAELRLKLMAARSNNEVRRLRDEIFAAEQARWVTPGVSILRAQTNEPVRIEQVQRQLGASTVIFEYVLADPSSYCLVITKKRSRIVRLESKQQIEKLITAYLEQVKARRMALVQARKLYDALLLPIAEATRHNVLVVVRDGPLHLVPFDAFRDARGRYVAETRSVTYVPSATAFHLLGRQKQRRGTALLAVGGVPYSVSNINKSGLVRGYERAGFANLPSSADEVRLAASTMPNIQHTLLIGNDATESALKRADLERFGLIHLAVHAVADKIHPDRAALIVLSDAKAGEDGFLQASEVAQLRLKADLVVLSACETSVGALQGQEGVANLSRAFLLAGARSVISTLWQVDDDASLFLMKRFYSHLADNKPAGRSLTEAKRDMLRMYGSKALPHQWAGFTFEGALESNGAQ